MEKSALVKTLVHIKSLLTKFLNFLLIVAMLALVVDVVLFNSQGPL